MIIIAGIASANMPIGHSWRTSSHSPRLSQFSPTNSGKNAAAATMLPSETYRLSDVTIIHTASAASPAWARNGQTPQTAPRPVATPLPPRKPSQNDSTCPQIAAAAMSSHAACTPKAGTSAESTLISRPATNTGTKPLATSSAKHM